MRKDYYDELRNYRYFWVPIKDGALPWYSGGLFIESRLCCALGFISFFANYVTCGRGINIKCGGMDMYDGHCP